MQTDYPISASRLDLILIIKKLPNEGFCCSNWPQREKEKSGTIDKYLDLATEQKKKKKDLWSRVTKSIWSAWTVLKGLEKQEHRDHCTDESD